MPAAPSPLASFLDAGLPETRRGKRDARDSWPESLNDLLPYAHIEDAHRGDIVFEPWPHLQKTAALWEEGGDHIILKARQLGISWLAALYARHVASRPGARVLVLSMSREYAYEFLAKVEYIDRMLPEKFRAPRKTDNAGELSWEDQGTITALPSTQNAGRGFTGTLVIADEGAFHPWASDNYRAYRPTVADGGQTLIVSTANGPTGWYPDMWFGAMKKENGYTATFIPWDARPDRDAKWLAKEKAAFRGLPAEFKQEYPRTAAEAFVALTGLVYPQFSEERHGYFDQHGDDSDPVPWAECLYRYAGVDLGGGDPSAMGAWGVWRHPADGSLHFHKYAEWVKLNGAPGAEELEMWLSEWHDLAPFTWIEGDSIPGAESTNTTLKNVYKLPVRTTRSKRYEGLGNVASWLEQDLISYNVGKCPQTMSEYTSYRWATTVDPNDKSRYKTRTPHDNHGDQMDADRRALWAMYMDLINIDTASGGHMAYAGVDI